MQKRPRVMMVDDDQEVLQMLRRVFEFEGFDVTTAADGSSALALFAQSQPDVVILDIALPGLDGYQVLENIRQSSDIPVIMLTAMRELEPLHRAMSLGADDYVSKPFRPLELVTRAQAKLRRDGLRENRPKLTFRSNGLTIDLVERKINLDNKEVKLTATEYRILSYLLSNAGRMVTPGQIIDKVWGEKHSGDNHILQVNMARLRQKLGDNIKNPRHILTKYSQGYILVK